jgi:hypothetical protein
MCLLSDGPARAGIDMNDITFRHLTDISWVDPCKHGISRYSLVTGKAWHYEIHINLRLRALLNSLEHLSSYIQLTFELAMTGIPPSAVILAGA